MPTQEVPITPHTLPAGYCFTTLQDLLDTFSAHQTADIETTGVGLVVSASTPVAGDQDKVWLKLDGLGNPVNFYWFNGGSWVEVNPPNVFWGVASNIVNAYTLAVAKPPAALVTGQLYLFKVPAANTGAATLQVNAFGVFPFNAGGVALNAGQLVANTIVGAVWTGTTFELLGGVATFNVSQLTPGLNTQRVTTTGGVSVWQGGYERITPIAVPVATGVTTIAHSLGVTPDLLNVYLECLGNNSGFVTGERIPIAEVYTSVGQNENPVLGATWSSTSLKIRCFNFNNGYSVIKGDGTNIVDLFPQIANWQLGADLWVF